jgi:hypothetical protein
MGINNPSAIPPSQPNPGKLWGSAVLNLCSNLIANKITTSWGWIFVLLAAGTAPFLWQFRNTERAWRQRNSIRQEFKNNPVSATLVCVLFIFVIVFTVKTGWKSYASQPDKQDATKSAEIVKNSTPTPDSSGAPSTPLVVAIPPAPALKKAKVPAPIKPPITPTTTAPITVGTDSVGMGLIPPGTKIGDRSVLVGATDSNGNTIIPGGTAVGYGAHADPTSVAIGSNAGGGQQPSTQQCATGSQCNSANGGGTIINPTVINNAPIPRTLTNDQITKLNTAIAQIPEGIQVKIGAADSGESYGYADQIRRALGIKREVGTFIGGHFKGVIVTVTSSSDAAAAPAEQLVISMRKAGIPTVSTQEDSTHDHPGEIGIFVGEQ